MAVERMAWYVLTRVADTIRAGPVVRPIRLWGCCSGLDWEAVAGGV